MSFISQIYVTWFTKYLRVSKSMQNNLDAHSEKLGELGLTAGI